MRCKLREFGHVLKFKKYDVPNDSMAESSGHADLPLSEEHQPLRPFVLLSVETVLHLAILLRL